MRQHCIYIHIKLVPPDRPITPALPTLEQLALQLLPGVLACALPSFVFSVPAGFPSPATDYMEDGIDLNDYLVRHKSASFLFRVRGDSMLFAGIIDGDRVVVDRSIEAKHNHIIIAVLDGEYTIKRLYRQGNHIELRPDNPAHQPILLAPGAELQVWGVVVRVARRCLY